MSLEVIVFALSAEPATRSGVAHTPDLTSHMTSHMTSAPTATFTSTAHKEVQLQCVLVSVRLTN